MNEGGEESESARDRVSESEGGRERACARERERERETKTDRRELASSYLNPKPLTLTPIRI